MHQQQFLLAKIGEDRYMRDLVVDGTVFMQRISTYKKLEDGNVRGDKNEGLAMRFDGRNPTLKAFVKIGAKIIPLKGSSLVIHSPDRDHGAYCMYAFPVPEERGPLTLDISQVAEDSRLRTFGDVLVVFHDTKEFARRLKHAANVAGYDVEGRAVDYVPITYCGDVGPFRKLDGYAYQTEFRFVTDRPLLEASLTLSLGSLRDIAIAVDLNKMPATAAIER